MISSINVFRSTRGLGHPNVMVRSFSTREDAEAYVRQAQRIDPNGFYSFQTVVDVDAVRKDPRL